MAGVDQKEQRKDSNYLLTLSEKRMADAQRLEEGDSHLTEEEKRIRAKARDRAKEEFRKKQHEEWKLIDKANNSKMGCHWSEKPLEVNGYHLRCNLDNSVNEEYFFPYSSTVSVAGNDGPRLENFS